MTSMHWADERHPGAVDATALLAGLSLPLAFAPFGLYPIAVVAPAVLFTIWMTCTPGRAFWRGLLFGVGLFGFGVSWIHESFSFANVSLTLAILFTGILVAFLALYPALLGYASTRFLRRVETSKEKTVWLLIVLPVGWVLTEWVRGWFLTGFTWLQLGYSQVASPLSGVAPVLGVYGVSWAVAFSSSLLVLALIEPRRRWRLCAPLLLLIWASFGALRTIDWTEPAAAPVRVALVQGNVPQELKWQPEQRFPTLERYLSLTRRHWDSDLVIWPETALPGFYHEFPEYISRLRAEAQEHKTDLLLGIAVLDKPGRRYFNSVMAPTSQPTFYHKRHLVPFGEYVPLKAFIGGILDIMKIPMSDFSAGEASQALPEVSGYKVGLSICYEAAFGSEIRKALPEAALLVNLSNDAWFGDSLGPHQGLEIVRMRAMETGRYVLRATNTGLTAVVSPDGKIQAQAPQFETYTLEATVTPRSGITPHSRFGDLSTVLVLSALLVVTWLPARRRK